MREHIQKNSIKYFGLIVSMLGIIFSVNVSQARTNVTDWYIQDFTSQIVVSINSTLDITESIVADCGSAVGKHGIFRILPTSAMIGNVKTQMPVSLVSITDQNGQAIQYSEKKDIDTVTWQIGDPKVAVNGVHTYKIHYKIKNIMRFDDSKFDELYWNLNGNFWDLQTDHFLADIIFPDSINQQNATVEYYTGALGSKNRDLATYHWKASNVLEFESVKMIDMRQGITTSIIFPKNIITPYQPTFWEKYGEYFFMLIPLIILIICFWLWLKYGKDPRMDKTIIPEYDVPDNLSPIELGMLEKSGDFDNKFITAEIIFLATRGLLTITEKHEKILFMDSKDYEFSRKENSEAEKGLNAAQQKILSHIFEGAKTRKLSEMKSSFYVSIPTIKDAAKKLLQDKDLVVLTGLYIKNTFRVIAILTLAAAFMAVGVSIFASLSFLATTIIVWIFSFIMPKRTQAGTELNWRVSGFRLFMETVDKDRAAFYEKENIFEKCLPYAIVFGMTEQWINRMQEIYGQEFYNAYAPVWYAGNLGSFDVNNFSDTINSLSDDIAANTSAPSSSGSGGFGGSGGGGGGGGGGGW